MCRSGRRAEEPQPKATLVIGGVLYSINSFIFENFDFNINYLHTSTESDICIDIIYIYIQSHRPSQCPPAGHQPLRRLRHHLRCGLFAPSPLPTIPLQFHLYILFGIGLGNMVFGLCRGAWPYKGLCTAGGKLAAEALRVLKKSIQHAGARKTRLGRRPLIP